MISPILLRSRSIRPLLPAGRSSVTRLTSFGVGAALLTAALVGCQASAPPQAQSPRPLLARDAPSDGEIPAENLRGASGGGDYDEGVAALDDGNIDGAMAVYTRMHDRDPKDGAAPALLGLIREKAGDTPEAEKAYVEAIRMHAGLEGPYIHLSALLLGEKRYPDALRVARAGIAQFSSNPALHGNAGVALAMTGDAAGAKTELDEAAREAPDDPMRLVTFGHWLGVWKQDDAAVAKLRAARGLAKEPGVLVAVGREMKAIGAFADCVLTFDRALSIRDTPELRTHRAVCKWGAKDKEGAKADLQAALNAGYAPAHFYLARFDSDDGDWKGAVSEYQSFLKLEPTVPAAKEARERLRLAEARARK
ncbi:MAG TPA: tetratricopeptide repeat protein [Polyangiaceae bacterium]|jgi:tetratricopeptide (TPR) repeat protein